MGLNRDFLTAVPPPAQTSGVRFSARKVQQFIEKNTPPSQDNDCRISGTWNRPGRGPNGESST